ncbi:MAG TPA: hypothetical protein VFF32_13520 [Dermatophilaceae bacterium]|nr:hypothetical protein [Dermatophilaceae bacterium]
MKWSRAVHHLDGLAHACADMAERPVTVFPLRVMQLWAYGDVLTGHDDLDRLRVVLAVDLPVDDVAWLCPPQGAEHWSNATRLSQSPIVAMWRSTRAPLWNHHIRQPLLIWDESAGISVDALAALQDGTADALRLPEPAPGEMQARLEAELATSHRALESAAATYEQRRFSPGKLEPVADALWRASAGYLDVLRASGSGPGRTEA